MAYGIDRPAPVREDDGSAAMERFEEVRVWDEIDGKLGFERFESGSYAGEGRVGWLVNMQQVGWVQRCGNELATTEFGRGGDEGL